MDQRGCPAGYFTDRIMVYYEGNLNATLLDPPCDQPVAGWLGFGLSLIVVRVANNSILRWNRWQKKKLAAGKKAGTTGNVSRSEIIEAAILITQILFFALTSANIANTINSLSGVLHAIFGCSLGINHLYHVRRTVKLGRNMIPLSKNIQFDAKGDSILATLHVEDNLLRLLALFCCACILAILVIFSLGAIAFRSKFWPFQAALFLTSAYQISVTCMGVWQIERCKAALKGLLNEEILFGTVRTKLERATTAMSTQQLVVAGLTLPAIILCALFALGEIPLYWWLVCLVFFCADNLTIVSIKVIFGVRQCLKTREPNQESSNNPLSAFASNTSS